jgi:hypothetical protein
MGMTGAMRLMAMAEPRISASWKEHQEKEKADRVARTSVAMMAIS